MRPFRPLPFLSLIVLGACGSGSTTIAATSFDQQCTSASDCVTVEDGDVCGCYSGACGATAAINRTSLSAFNAEVSALQSNCSQDAPIACPADCIFSTAVCKAGTCTISYGVPAHGN
jgi:hypothetical protein